MNNTAVVFVSLVAAFVFVSSVNAAALNRERRAVVEIDDPDYVLELLTRLGHSIIRANELEKFVRSSGSAKRGLDLGLGRGFSGSQAAKHLMGLAAANFAGGPGRRRRSPEDALTSVHRQDDNVILYDHERAPVTADVAADAAPAMVETTGTQSR
ncbi:diuretic hormone class 2-like isoform X1 [Penaeus japonicus]|uniref:diuretic hormone class 2-like isoform X1 n=1 Tax=Penaeus japonicus TaxID=27405 RepID=UPI001C70BCE5|nr:diuretic hormone class 2-like isoform X1 [Penaeus japonicus]